MNIDFSRILLVTVVASLAVFLVEAVVPVNRVRRILVAAVIVMTLVALGSQFVLP